MIPSLPLLKVKAQRWKTILAEQLRAHGYHIQENSWGVTAWQEGNIKRLDKKTEWVESVEVRPSWLGRDKEYISVSNKRQYLDSDRSIIREYERGHINLRLVRE